MVRHPRRVIEKAAQYGIMLDVHEPIHDTGERRTYPNMMSREGARGQEYNAWSSEGGNPPEHETILFFTRMLDGPMDFTPGIFDILIERGTGRPRRPDEPARTFDVALTFLTPGRKYVAEIYADGPGANWLTNPLPVTISKRSVDATSRLHIVLAPGGGQAIRIRPVR